MNKQEIKVQGLDQGHVDNLGRVNTLLLTWGLRRAHTVCPPAGKRQQRSGCPWPQGRLVLTGPDGPSGLPPLLREDTPSCFHAELCFSQRPSWQSSARLWPEGEEKQGHKPGLEPEPQEPSGPGKSLWTLPLLGVQTPGQIKWAWEGVGVRTQRIPKGLRFACRHQMTI